MSAIEYMQEFHFSEKEVLESDLLFQEKKS
jgi:hypothetical protein